MRRTRERHRWSVPKRTGKIFMDYNMNVRGKTLNVAYSPRGAAGAPVSMPLTWDNWKKPIRWTRLPNAAQFWLGQETAGAMAGAKNLERRWPKGGRRA
jgi:bifunctional non-homologous end joining protein LigD